MEKRPKYRGAFPLKTLCLQLADCSRNPNWPMPPGLGNCYRYSATGLRLLAQLPECRRRL